MDLFTRQLQDLLAALEIDSPIRLVGLSMGGPITAAFTVQHPAAVAGNVLIDPAGVRPSAPGILRILALPGMGEIVLGIFGREELVKNVASDLFGPALVEQFQVRYREQMRFAGFKRSILSTLRSGMLGGFANTYRTLGLLGKPTLLLWGRKDHAVPLSHGTELLKLVPQAEFHIIEQASHIPHYERPEDVNPILLDFLSRT
jgi:pimeloyl-ACP methyl ester carboxylesterase